MGPSGPAVQLLPPAGREKGGVEQPYGWRLRCLQGGEAGPEGLGPVEAGFTTGRAALLVTTSARVAKILVKPRLCFYGVEENFPAAVVSFGGRGGPQGSWILLGTGSPRLCPGRGGLVKHPCDGGLGSGLPTSYLRSWREQLGVLPEL